MLYVIATPIGNLQDITLRALDILKSVDVILAEDTRITKRLLTHYEIEKPMVSYHQHSKLDKIDYVVELLSSGKNVALVTDAGTPGISDPGARLVEVVLERLPEVKIVPIPGPSAVATALSVSGFSFNRFTFLGFPPHKKGRETFFKEVALRDEVLVLYESTHRIEKFLTSLAAIMPERKMLVARELTKQFETLYRGTAESILKGLNSTSSKGEFVIVIDKI